MEQTITIDGRKVTFKADGATPLRYRVEFKRDYFGDIIKMTSVLKGLNEGSEVNFDNLDMSVFSDIIYLLAKTADKEIGDMFEWYASFDNFPLFEVFEDLQDLLLSNMQTMVKKAKKK